MHHLTKDNEFKSDKYPELPAGKIILSFRDPAAQKALRVYAWLTNDVGLAADILFAINTIEEAAK